MLKAQEILSRQLALSEGGRALEEGDVDESDPLRVGLVGDFLGDHLAERKKQPNAPQKN